jgi:hypothetical protein
MAETLAKMFGQRSGELSTVGVSRRGKGLGCGSGIVQAPCWVLKQPAMVCFGRGIQDWFEDRDRMVVGLG